METAKYHDGFTSRCAYCHNDLKQGMGFDEPYYYCDCNQAKLERDMQNEIHNVIKEIKGKYSEMLKIDNDKIKEMKIKGHIYNAVYDVKVSISGGFAESGDVESAFHEAMKKVY